MSEDVLNTEQKIVLSYLKGLRKIYEWETIFGLIRRFHVNYSDSYMGGNVQEAYFKLHEDERTVALIAFCEWDMIKEVAECLEECERVCGWRLSTVLDYVVWLSDCGLDWQFSNPETPADNEMVYCPKCGRKLEVSE